MKKYILFITIFTFFILTNSYSKNKTITELITISPQMKERIFKSPFKAILKTKDGNQFVAYLFAEDEKKDRYTHSSCISGDSRSSVSRVGHYFIYLYDVQHDYFLPYKTAILKNLDFKETRFNNEGYSVIVLSGSQGNKSDVLLISQFADCGGNFYEAYGFLGNKPYLQNYTFVGKIKEKLFYGRILPEESKTASQLYAYSQYGLFHEEFREYFLSLSNKPGEILVKPKPSNEN